MVTLNKIMRLPVGSKGAGLALGFLVATSLWSADFSFTTGQAASFTGSRSVRSASA
jgi:hypothetical protein